MHLNCCRILFLKKNPMSLGSYREYSQWMGPGCSPYDDLRMVISWFINCESRVVQLTFQKVLQLKSPKIDSCGWQIVFVYWLYIYIIYILQNQNANADAVTILSMVVWWLMLVEFYKNPRPPRGTWVNQKMTILYEIYFSKIMEGGKVG